MTDNENYSEEIDLLDLLVVIVESWILLVVGPIIVALLVFGYFQIQSQQQLESPSSEIASNYISTVTVALPVGDARLIDSPENITAALDSSNIDTSHNVVANGLKIEAGNNPENSIITLTLDNADTSKELLLNLLENFSQTTGINLHKTQLAEAELTYAETEDRIAYLTLDFERINTALNRIENTEIFDGLAFSSTFSIRSEINSELIKLRQSQLFLNAKMKQLFPNVLNMPIEVTKITSPVVLPVPETRSHMLKATLSGIATGFILLVFVFMRNSFRQANKTSEGSKKINRLKRAFWIKTR